LQPRFFRFPVVLFIFLLTAATFAVLQQEWAGFFTLAAMSVVLCTMAWLGFKKSSRRVLMAFYQLQYEETPTAGKSISTARMQLKHEKVAAETE
jgi:hypothetical protein